MREQFLHQIDAVHDHHFSLGAGSLAIDTEQLEGQWVTTDYAIGDTLIFHSLTVQSAQYFSVNPALLPRWSFERRNETAMGFLTTLQLEPLISHVVDFAEAPRAYEMIDRTPEEASFVVFRYGNTS